jgi:hypothetical protein
VAGFRKIAGALAMTGISQDRDGKGIWMAKEEA